MNNKKVLVAFAFLLASTVVIHVRAMPAGLASGIARAPAVMSVAVCVNSFQDGADDETEWPSIQILSLVDRLLEEAQRHPLLADGLRQAANLAFNAFVTAYIADLQSFDSLISGEEAALAYLNYLKRLCPVAASVVDRCLGLGYDEIRVQVGDVLEPIVVSLTGESTPGREERCKSCDKDDCLPGGDCMDEIDPPSLQLEETGPVDECVESVAKCLQGVVVLA